MTQLYRDEKHKIIHVLNFEDQQNRIYWCTSSFATSKRLLERCDCQNLARMTVLN